ncbi:MAG TPA: methyltransferase domain-containing protein [Vicinamibacterales bacterium]|jgi:ubiquinone/menaquinone biosynthesis C-methylase UbiE|nr:methyltransferase domain-containing protein [Vicinamibacterales bacterium]
MPETAPSTVTLGTTGIVVHRAVGYDFIIWLMTLGRPRAFRDALVGLARLQPGESVLDVGCGTGSLAIAAERRVGPTGTVQGVDASPEMIDRAHRKAMNAGVTVTFRQAVAEALPFPDSTFDAVLSTVMLHHLPRKARQQCVGEIRRVLKPGGRVLVVDFASSEKQGSLIGHFHRHGHVELRDIITLLSDEGLATTESGAVGIRNLQFALAVKP